MSFYETQYQQPISRGDSLSGPDGLGAFYETQYEQPITGEAGDQHLRENLHRRLRGNVSMPGHEAATIPAAVFATWATVDEADQIVALDRPTGTLTVAWALSDDALRAAQADAFGSSFQRVAVVSEGEPRRYHQAAAAFQGSPYQLVGMEVVYDQGDPSPLPRPLVLYLAQLRDLTDREGGRQSLDAVASLLGGRLYHVSPGAQSQRSRPHPSIGPEVVWEALRLGAALPAQVAGLGNDPAAVVAASTTQRGSALLLWGGLIAGAALMVYGATRKPKRRK